MRPLLSMLMIPMLCQAIKKDIGGVQTTVGHIAIDTKKIYSLCSNF